jgi:hypothetical protein
MAARINKIRHDDETRAKIQTSQLVNRLTDHALGVEGVKLEPTQVKAIEILLRKTLPDLQATELTGGDGGPVQIQRIERVIVGDRKLNLIENQGENGEKGGVLPTEG